MSDRIEHIKAELEASRAHLMAIVDAVDGRWEARVYSDGLEWTVRQLLNHLADAERGHYNQVINIAEGRDIIPPDFDIERYNASVTRKTADKTAEQALQDLTKSRGKLVFWLDSLDDSKLDQKGRHASLRILTVAQILEVVAAHERGHADDIAAALGISIE